MMTVSSWDKLVSQNSGLGSASESDSSDDDLPLSQASVIKQKELVLKQTLAEPSNDEPRVKKEMTSFKDVQRDHSNIESSDVLKAEHDSNGSLSAISKEKKKKNKKKRKNNSVENNKLQDKDIDSDTLLKKIKLEKKKKKKKETVKKTELSQEEKKKKRGGERKRRRRIQMVGESK